MEAVEIVFDWYTLAPSKRNPKDLVRKIFEIRHTSNSLQTNWLIETFSITLS